MLRNQNKMSRKIFIKHSIDGKKIYPQNCNIVKISCHCHKQNKPHNSSPHWLLLLTYSSDVFYYMYKLVTNSTENTRKPYKYNRSQDQEGSTFGPNIKQNLCNSWTNLPLTWSTFCSWPMPTLTKLYVQINQIISICDIRGKKTYINCCCLHVLRHPSAVHQASGRGWHCREKLLRSGLFIFS